MHPEEIIMSKIYIVRWHKVMLDRDLADIFGVETKYLKRQTTRNKERFPDDFMFQLHKKEQESIRWQFGTLKQWQHSKYLPYAYTEHGILMLSAVLKSERALHMSISIMRIFNQMREVLSNHNVLFEKLHTIEWRLEEHDKQFSEIRFEIKKILELEIENDTIPIGFNVG